MIAVDKDIPIPRLPQVRKLRPWSGERYWPFSRMEIGDSFQIPEGREKTADVAAHKYKVNHGLVFTRREYNGRRRMWRIR